MKKKIKEFARRFGYDIVPFRLANGKPDPLAPWEIDTDFLDIYEKVVPVTLVDRKRLYMIWQYVKKTELLQGDLAECGVYRGGTALLIARSKGKSNTLHLFDTFEGMPQTDSTKDFHKPGDFIDTSLHFVQSFLKDEVNVDFHPGFFPDTAENLQDRNFSFVHCDMDIYQSVIDCCNFFYPRLVQGGLILFDDYGAASCPGARQAVDEFCSQKGLYSVYLPTGQAVLYKY